MGDYIYLSPAFVLQHVHYGTFLGAFSNYEYPPPPAPPHISIAALMENINMHFYRIRTQLYQYS